MKIDIFKEIKKYDLEMCNIMLKSLARDKENTKSRSDNFVQIQAKIRGLSVEQFKLFEEQYIANVEFAIRNRIAELKGNPNV